MPKKKSILVVTDRGGHLHDALRLVGQMERAPEYLVTTEGPDVDSLKKSTALSGAKIACIPQAFFWIGKKRLWSPWRFFKVVLLSLSYAIRFRPSVVISTGASNVVFVCLFSKMLGAKLVHIENLAQVVNPSITGKILYPFADHFFVQWQELLKAYGPKARYEGWVI